MQFHCWFSDILLTSFALCLSEYDVQVDAEQFSKITVILWALLSTMIETS